MAKPWRLTRQAEESLTEIASWTSEHFGARQVRAYQQDLISLCGEVAEGTAQSQGCKEYLSPEVSDDLRFARLGGHLVVFVELEAEIVITDFLHARRDLPRWLTGPE